MDAYDAVIAQFANTPGLRLRQGTVSAINSGYTLTVTIAGATTSVSGVKYLSTCAPVVGGGVWLLTDGRDLIALDSVEKGWNAYTPTLTPASGAITTSSAVGRWKRLGGTVLVSAAATITTAGTGAGALSVSLPFTAANLTTGYVGAGRETASTSNALTAYVAPNTAAALVNLYTGATCIVNGYVNTFTVSYETV